jgi:hypothetical protein
MKFKKLKRPIQVTDDFIYCLREGYIKLEQILENQSDRDKVQEALDLLLNLETDLEEAGLVEFH